MKLHKTQRCELAERICARWIVRRKIRMRRPNVYLIMHPKAGSKVWGWCHHRSKPLITLHVGPATNKRDIYILLAHEFAHSLDYQTKQGKWRDLPHGERFQRILWGTLPRGLWKRASSGVWIIGRSKHRPEFQPILDYNFEAAA